MCNIIDTFDLIARDSADHDLLIKNTQDLRRLLEKAINYCVTDWQNEPVWIETRGICETNTRYAIIYDSSDATTTGDSIVAEVSEATQYESKYISFGEAGIKVYKGIYLLLSNARAVVHYR